MVMPSGLALEAESRNEENDARQQKTWQQKTWQQKILQQKMLWRLCPPGSPSDWSAYLSPVSHPALLMVQEEDG